MLSVFGSVYSIPPVSDYKLIHNYDNSQGFTFSQSSIAFSESETATKLVPSGRFYSTKQAETFDYMHMVAADS